MTGMSTFVSSMVFQYTPNDRTLVGITRSRLQTLFTRNDVNRIEGSKRVSNVVGALSGLPRSKGVVCKPVVPCNFNFTLLNE